MQSAPEIKVYVSFAAIEVTRIELLAAKFQPDSSQKTEQLGYCRKNVSVAQLVSRSHSFPTRTNGFDNFLC